MRTGVYAILNTLTNKIYVGSASRGYVKRLEEHKNKLLAGTHPNIHLQRAWNKDGRRVQPFIFQILEDCPPESCIQREQFWIDYHDSSNDEKGYNPCPTAGSLLGHTPLEV